MASKGGPWRAKEETGGGAQKSAEATPRGEKKYLKGVVMMHPINYFRIRYPVLGGGHGREGTIRVG